MVRNSLRYVPWKQRKAVAADLKKSTRRAPSLKDAEAPLGALETTWDQEFPTISKSLACPLGAPDALFAFPKDIRRVIYTTNAIESLNSTLRKIIKTRPRVFRS
jgi:transposase-like protein